METLINFETAKLAKEKGIELPHTHFYVLEFSTFKANKTAQRNSLPNDNSENFLQIVKNRKGQPHIAPAYSQSILQKYLREIQEKVVQVFPTKEGYGWIIEKTDGYLLVSSGFSGKYQNGKHDTYEEALDAGLNEALELINP